MVQWHPTVLSKLALVPQQLLGTYTDSEKGEAYLSGDFVVVFNGCGQEGQTSCESQADGFVAQWRANFSH